MRIEQVPFCTTEWSSLIPSEHPGKSGCAYWRTFEEGNVRARMVEYSPGYEAGGWCSRGHVLLVLEGEVTTDLQDGRSYVLKPGSSFQAADNDVPHRNHTKTGARVFIVD